VGRETLYWLITILGTCIIIVGLSAIFFTWRAYTYYRTHKSIYSGDSLLISDPLMGFRQRPGITVTMKNPHVAFYTDNRGGRAPGPGINAPAQVDVLAIGCSFTWGQAIKDEETYIRIIGSKLGLTTYNAAVSSYGTSAALLSLKNFADLQPKIVIYGFIADHINRSLNPCAPCLSGLCRGVAHVAFDANGNPFIAKPVTSHLYYQHIEDIIKDHKFGLKDVYWEIVRTLNFIPKWESRIDRYDERQIISGMRFLMMEMVRETQKTGAKLIIVYIPYPGDIKPPPKEFMEAIGAILAANKAVFVDLTVPFLESQRRREVLSTPDNHPNALGHKLIAHNVEPLIRSFYK